MSFKAVLLSAKELSRLTGFLKKMGERCLIKLKEDRIIIVSYTTGAVSTSAWVKVDPEAIFCEYTLDSPLNILVPARELNQMIHAVTHCTYTSVELITNREQAILRFTSQSDMAEEIGELDVDVVTDRQIRDVKEPGSIAPDVCLCLPPLGTLVNFVKAHSRKIESLRISGSPNGTLMLAVKGPHVTGELVTEKLEQPNLNISLAEPEDPDALFTVNVRSRQINKFLSCKTLGITNSFFSLVGDTQITFFIFFSLGSGTNSSLTVHVPLFIE